MLQNLKVFGCGHDSTGGKFHTQPYVTAAVKTQAHYKHRIKLPSDYADMYEI